MSNIRTLILSAALVVLLLLVIPLTTARTETASNPAGASVGVPDNSEVSIDQREAHIPSYRSRLDDCFDVPVSGIAACRAEGKTLIPSYRSQLDQCFDVLLSELAACRSESQTLAPSHHSSPQRAR